MKLTYLIRLSIVAVIICSGAVGCKKGLQKVTPLPGSDGSAAGRMGLGDSPVGGIGDGTGTGAGIPFGNETFENYTQDRETFAAQTVYFDFDQSIVKASEISKLEAVASRMASMTGKALRIEGHCDERGTEDYNNALGERRALSVREQLVRLGMDPNRIVTKTLGEQSPADLGHTPEAWAKNRRGEIVLLSPPGGTP